METAAPSQDPTWPNDPPDTHPIHCQNCKTKKDCKVETTNIKQTSNGRCLLISTCPDCSRKVTTLVGTSWTKYFLGEPWSSGDK